MYQELLMRSGITEALLEEPLFSSTNTNLNILQFFLGLCLLL